MIHLIQAGKSSEVMRHVSSWIGQLSMKLRGSCSQLHGCLELTLMKCKQPALVEPLGICQHSFIHLQWWGWVANGCVHFMPSQPDFIGTVARLSLQERPFCVMNPFGKADASDNLLG